MLLLLRIKKPKLFLAGPKSLNTSLPALVLRSPQDEEDLLSPDEAEHDVEEREEEAGGGDGLHAAHQAQRAAALVLGAHSGERLT